MSKATLFIATFQGIDCRRVAPVVTACYWEPAEWDTTPVAVDLPEGWEISESKHGTIELYDAKGAHRQLMLIDGTIDAINEFGVEHLPVIA